MKNQWNGQNNKNHKRWIKIIKWKKRMSNNLWFPINSGISLKWKVKNSIFNISIKVTWTFLLNSLFWVALNRMKVLKISQDSFKWLGVIPIDEKNQRKKIFHYLFGIITCTFIILGLIGSLWYVITYARSNLANALYAGFQAVGFSCSMNSLNSIFLHHKIFHSIFKNLQMIYEQSTQKIKEIPFY